MSTERQSVTVTGRLADSDTATLMRPRIKICGVTSVEQAREAAAAGADAIGLVFHAASPRALEIEQAGHIAAAVPAFVSLVGLFMNPDRAEVERVLQSVPLELLQFHGEETADFCASFSRRYIKAVGMSSEPDLDAVAREYSEAAALLVDSHAGRRAGGSGEAFDWSRWRDDIALPLVLAGGLDEGNVTEAVRRLRPWGVDVSSGVESRPGVKDPRKMIRFIREVHRVS